jgi:SpoU rRNA methylase family enzyme
MEPSVLRRRVKEAIEAARQGAAARRATGDAASLAWRAARETVVVPAWQQTVQVLRSEGYLLQVSTPSDTVRVSSEKHPQDGVEVALETGSQGPFLLQRVTTSRGREVMSDERVAVAGTETIAALTEEQAVALLLSALAPWFER